VNRYLVLFAREPRREAREKGFGARGAGLFAGFAVGWREAARRCGARLILATPPEDRAAWRHFLPENEDALWIPQCGASFGDRLAGVARRASALPGHAVLVGGDVAPSRSALGEAFAALEQGADAVIAPAADGGVSLVALRYADAKLLASLAPRQRCVALQLKSALAARGRRLVLVHCVPDVDGRRSLGSLLRSLAESLRTLARRALDNRVFFPATEPVSLRAQFLPPSGLRAPPRPA
jgi:glycosyltransferase A (GT-A) superfamily protein (DUF2064 family)